MILRHISGTEVSRLPGGFLGAVFFIKDFFWLSVGREFLGMSVGGNFCFTCHIITHMCMYLSKVIVKKMEIIAT